MIAPRRANVAGLGLIGGSIARALTERGWHVSGLDQVAGRPEQALERGYIAALGLDPTAEITFVATPVLSLGEQVQNVLDTTSGVVTDVGSVKSGVAAAITDPRFIGGHPMAGSELEGLDGHLVLTFNGGEIVHFYEFIQEILSTLGHRVLV